MSGMSSRRCMSTSDSSKRSLRPTNENLPSSAIASSAVRAPRAHAEAGDEVLAEADLRVDTTAQRFELGWPVAERLIAECGALGLATGSGYLDMGIINYGIQSLPFGFKILANLPHIGLGGIALLSSLLFGKENR